MAASRSTSRDSGGRFQASKEPKAKPVQVWLKPDVLQRLDTYCAFYGVGRGRAIGHLLQGALPDPNWLPPVIDLLEEAEPAATRGNEPDHSQHEQGRALKPMPCFQVGDRVCNKASGRCGVIADEPLLWVEPGPAPTGMRGEAHWSYAVAWDGQLGLTLRYAEYLLGPEDVA
jgi:hypothetical protein